MHEQQMFVYVDEPKSVGINKFICSMNYVYTPGLIESKGFKTNEVLN